MTIRMTKARRQGTVRLTTFMLMSALSFPLSVWGQQTPPPDHTAHHPATTQVTAGEPGVAQQLAELKKKVSALESAVNRNSTTPAMGKPMQGGMSNMGAGMNSGQMSGGKMGSMPMAGGSGGAQSMAGMSGGQGGMMGEMGMMQGMMSPMGGSGMAMPGNAQGSMQGMSGGMMGMMNMMGMAPSPSVAMSAALPGFPGASHIYHVGSTDFFLNHGDHIGLSVSQRSALGQLKEKTTLDQAAAERKVEQAEQELWTLTAADQPDAAAIEGKLGEIEKLRTSKRLSFIRAVGEAATLLTPEQRQILLGLKAPVPAMTPGSTPAPMGGGSMNDM